MRIASFLGFLAFAAAVLSTPATAQPRGSIMPLDQILPGIRRAHPGEFYDADGPTPGPGGSQHYHLKWMTPDGRVVWYDADARTGRVLGTSRGRDNFDPDDTRVPRVYAPSGQTPGQAPGRAAPYDGYGPRGYEPRGDVPRGNFDSGRGYDTPYGGGWRDRGGAPREQGGFDRHGGGDRHRGH